MSAIVALCVYGGTSTRVFSSVALHDITDRGLVYNVTGAMWAYVIILTFGNVLEWTYLFLNFFNFYFLLRLVTTPHVFYVHMTYVYSLSLCFSLHMITWPREVIIVL